MLALTATAELAALDLRSGKELWKLSPDGPLPRQERHQGSPVAGDGRVFFETRDGRLHAADAGGALLWKRDLGVDVTTSLLLTPRGLHAGLADGRIVRLDPETGEIAGAIALEDMPFGAIVPAGEALLVLIDNQRTLVAVEATLGKTLWRREQEGSWSAPRPTVWGDAVVMGSEQGEVQAYALADGAPRWRRRLEGVPRGMRATDGVLYVGTLGGRLYADRPKLD